MSVTRNPIPRVLIAWIGAGIVRVLLGSSTSPIAYFFFGVFWLISAVLLIAAVRQLILSKKMDQRIEAGAICAGLASLFAQGLLGNGETIAVAAIVFLVSAIVLVLIYGRRLRRQHQIHP
jgi:predicted Co/Zn/Cd cation transporter (cation efflux family)